MQGLTQTERRVVLVRHAHSAHVHAGWVSAAGFRAWRVAYEAAGIRADERVPDHLGHLVGRADLVLSSDSVRAVASARLLAPGQEIVVSPLLRELELEGPALGGLRLPLGMWAVAVGVRTLVRTVRGQYPSPAEAARIGDAAAWLEDLAAQHALTVVVTHAMFRRRLSARLEQTGWQAERWPRSMRPWSAWIYRRAVLGA